MNRALPAGMAVADARETGAVVGQRQHTAWVPWSDVPIGESGLCVVEVSLRHRDDVQVD